MIAFSLLFSLLVAVLNALVNPAVLPTHLGRFLLSVFLWWALYRGYHWARLVWILLAALAALFGFGYGFDLLSQTPLLALLLLGLAALYLWVAGILLFSTSVNAFLVSRRRGRQ
nr:hypothetical protein [Ardenticatenales bacterium]